jgi:C1A family cysteine protease
MDRAYTWKPDIPDFRDHRFGTHLMLHPTIRVPAIVDLRDQLTPVFDQGAEGSCTGNALAGYLECLEKKASGPAEGENSFFPVSRQFIYYQERVIEDTVAWDEGAEIRDGVKACATVGYCSEAVWPYAVGDFALKPSDAAYADAAQHKISEYLRAETMDDFRGALAAGFPVVFGFTVYDSFESPVVAATGEVPMPLTSEARLGGHAVLMVGYNDEIKRVLVRNSWGDKWGQAGYFTMPYEYVTDRDLSDDFWVIRK